MKQISLIIGLIILSSIYALSQQPPDSCLKYYNEPTDSTFRNRDSVKVDSCLDSPTYGVDFGKKNFYLKFNYNIIPRTYLAPADSIIDYTIDSINNKYTVAIYEFNQLRQLYGNFKFREIHPNLPDTTTFLLRNFYLIFENYVPIKEVEKVLLSFSCLNTAGFISWYGIVSEVDEKSIIFLHPNPVKDILDLTFLTSSNFEMISIYNLNGLKVLESNYNEQINVAELQPGIYFMRCGDKTYKFIKE